MARPAPRSLLAAERRVRLNRIRLLAKELAAILCTSGAINSWLGTLGIAKRVEGRISDASEEILVSILGSLLCDDETDRDALMFKAVAELTDRGESPDAAFKRLQELRDLFEALL